MRKLSSDTGTKKKDPYWANWMIWSTSCYKVDNVAIPGYLTDYSVYLISRIVLGLQCCLHCIYWYLLRIKKRVLKIHMNSLQHPDLTLLGRGNVGEIID